jgi:germination protein M
MRFRAFAASALAVAILAGCGGDDDPSTEAQSTIPPTAGPAETATVPDTAPAILKVYFLQDGKVAVASRSVVAGPAVARAALVQLLEGPTAAESARGLSSAIPAGTELEDVTIDDDATAVVELSQSLDPAATAQVVYTVTQFPSVRRVRLEGTDYVRADFEDQTPAILVESPVPGEDVSSPLRIEGTANTFEATFQVEVVDARGRVVGERFVTATSGSGDRGTFDAVVTFAAMPGPVRLVTYEVSAEDGSRLNETAIPLQVAP